MKHHLSDAGLAERTIKAETWLPPRRRRRSAMFGGFTIVGLALSWLVLRGVDHGETSGQTSARALDVSGSNPGAHAALRPLSSITPPPPAPTISQPTHSASSTMRAAQPPAAHVARPEPATEDNPVLNVPFAPNIRPFAAKALASSLKGAIDQHDLGKVKFLRKVLQQNAGNELLPASDIEALDLLIACMDHRQEAPAHARRFLEGGAETQFKTVLERACH